MIFYICSTIVMLLLACGVHVPIFLSILLVLGAITRSLGFNFEVFFRGFKLIIKV